jgi:hypothetical protein
MKRRMMNLNADQAKKDVKRFVKLRELPSLEIWSRNFFLDRLKKLSQILR